METIEPINIEPRPSGEEASKAQAAAMESSELAEARTQCQKLLAEKQELYDRLLRKQAEFENFRKRAQREREEFSQHATEDLMKSILPVLDGFERALKHRDPGATGQVYAGIELIYRELLEALKRAGLSPVEAAGQMFDPHYHQAVERVETDKVRDHEVLEELQHGYKLRNRLLRPAIVKVAVAPGKPASRTDVEA